MGKQLILSQFQKKIVGSTKKISRRYGVIAVSRQDKIRILESVATKTGIPWEILAGLSEQESGFGIALSGDSGRSRGPFHIHLPSHPEISLEQAMDWQWSSNWAGQYLVELGARNDLFTALRKWNGSKNNPKTLVHAKRVMHHAKNIYGYNPIA